MKKSICLLFVMIIALSCRTLKISSDYDSTAVFDSYKTFAFIVYPENLPFDPNLSSIAISSVARELNSKGLKKAENADLLIDIKARSGNKKTVEGTSTGEYPDFYGYSYIYMWGAGFSTATINVNSYAEGTLFIDLIDARKKQLVWQGRGQATLHPDDPQQEREKNISEAVTRILEKYPPKK